jgi:hypothetical protein
MIRIEYLPPSPRAGEIHLETQEVATPLLRAGFARRAPEPEAVPPAVVSWRVEADAHSGVIWLRGVCQRGGERLAFSGNPAVLKGDIFFQHSCLGGPPERIPDKIIAEYSRQKREGQ